MRVAPTIALTAEVRLELEKLSRRRTTTVRVAQRSRIVLLAASGLENKQITEQMGVAPRMAALWRGRFIEQSVEGLMKDAPRPLFAEHDDASNGHFRVQRGPHLARSWTKAASHQGQQRSSLCRKAGLKRNSSPGCNAANPVVGDGLQKLTSSTKLALA